MKFIDRIECLSEKNLLNQNDFAQIKTIFGGKLSKRLSQQIEIFFVCSLGHYDLFEYAVRFNARYLLLKFQKTSFKFKINDIYIYVSKFNFYITLRLNSSSMLNVKLDVRLGLTSLAAAFDCDVLRLDLIGS